MPQPPNQPQPVRIEVPADKVDNTLPLDEILTAVARGAEAAVAGRAGTVPPPEVAQRLQKISELAKGAATEFQHAKRAMPDIEERIRFTGRGPVR